MPTVDLLELPFDQYQRYNTVRAVVELIHQQHQGSPRLRILDVGGYFRTLTGQDILPLSEFLPNDDVIALDMVPCSLPGYIRGNGAQLPFRDGGCDVVVTCDTLEHVPPAQREAFVAELLRVAAGYVILAAPFDDERTRLAEQVVHEYLKAAFGVEHAQLEEHLRYGLPNRFDLRSWLAQQGWSWVDFPDGYLHHWLPMMLLKHYTSRLHDPARLHLLLDRYYNSFFSASAPRAPGYRQVFVIARKKEDALLPQVVATFPSREGAPGDNGLAFAHSLINVLEWIFQTQAWRREYEGAAALETAILALGAIPGLPTLIEQGLTALTTQSETVLTDRTALAQGLAVITAQGKEMRRLRSIVQRSVYPGLRDGEVPGPRATTALPEGQGVLVLSPSPIGERMAGPSIRYWEFARAISQVASVTLAAPESATLTHPGFAVRSFSLRAEDRSLEELVAQHQVVVMQGFTFLYRPTLARTIAQNGKYLVVDLYGPVALEGLERRLGQRDEAAVRTSLLEWNVLNEQIKLADFFVCASERQRDHWLGLLGACYRLNPHTYADDRTARRLIDVVPFGLPPEPPVHRVPVLKGVHPRVAATDKVLVWLGGLWNWLDPLTVLRALAQLVTERQDVRLFFFSLQPGGTIGPEMEMAERAMALSRELELMDRFAFFCPWLTYEERGDYLLEADVGLSFHFDHLETHFSYRTRILDYIWAGLPIVAARGDVLGDLVEQVGLGYLADPGDVEGLTSALRRLLAEPNPRERRRDAFERLARQLSWTETTRPLQRYCAAPWRAADKSVPLYDAWQPTLWEQIVRDAVLAEDRFAHAAREATYYRDLSQRLLNGRVMRLMLKVQSSLQRGAGAR